MYNAKHVATIAMVTVFGLAALAEGILAQVPQDHQDRIREAVPSEPRVAVDEPRKVLVWSRAVGYRHSSIPQGAFAMKVMGEQTGAWETTETDDIRMLTRENLHQFDALILNNTTGDWIRPRDEDMQHFEGSKDEVEHELRHSILEFVANGGGLVGYHSAGDSNYHWPEFGRLLGGYFDGHPWNAGDTVGINVNEPNHLLCECFDETDFRITDEIYQFRTPYSRNYLRVLLSLNTDNTDMNRGGLKRTDGDFAVAWVRTYGEGRVFYSSLGHREDIFWNPTIMTYYRDGIQYALGDLDVDDLPSNVVKDEGYETLFDGSDLDRWTFREGGWEIDSEGNMALVEDGGYIWTKDAYEDFILDVEFKVAEGTNSGIFFRTDPGNAVQGGFEVQVYDTAANPNPGRHDAGSLYDAAAPLSNAMKPAGEWNRLVLICDGPRIHGILNGQVVLDLDIDTWDTANRNPDGSENKFDTALKDLPRTGHIGFQDHGDAVWYRNVRVKSLD